MDALVHRPEHCGVYREHSEGRLTNPVARPWFWPWKSLQLQLQLVLQDQLKDPFIHDKVQELQQGLGPKSTLFHESQGLLYHGNWLYVPAGVTQTRILHLFHDSLPTGHFRKHQRLNLVSCLFWWPQMKTTIQDYIASCATCQPAKDYAGKSKGLLLPLATPGTWQTLCLGFVVELPPSQRFMSILGVGG